MTNDVQVSVRLPKDLLDRADKLTELLRKNPDNALMGLTRMTVLRLAIARGLDALEMQVTKAMNPADQNLDELTPGTADQFNAVRKHWLRRLHEEHRNKGGKGEVDEPWTEQGQSGWSNDGHWYFLVGEGRRRLHMSKKEVDELLAR